MRDLVGYAGKILERDVEVHDRGLSPAKLMRIVVRAQADNEPALALPALAEAPNPARIVVLPISRLFSAGQARQIADQLCGH
jgi:hypothetical protein